MISYTEALAIVCAADCVLKTQQVPLLSACNRVLATPITAKRDIPAHDLSAMDGFAIRREDLPGPFTVIETIAAGRKPNRSIRNGECSRIMTGAIVPQGADMVVMFEDTCEQNGIVSLTGITTKTNIRYQGEDLKQGDLVLGSGVIITPSVLAVLASEGCDPVTVYQQPIVGIIATGDELVDPAVVADGAQIHNSNSYQVFAQVSSSGCIPHYFGIAKDTPDAIGSLFDKAFALCDIVVFSGGVSVGDFDFVPKILASRNITLAFQGIQVKPGKHTIFGSGKGKFVFGLPGNPVSSLVIFELLVKPLLYRMSGHTFTQHYISAKLEKSITRKNAKRLEFIPVQFTEKNTVSRVPYHGSAHIQAYTKAHGMIALQPDCDRLEQGDSVDVIVPIGQGY